MARGFPTRQCGAFSRKLEVATGGGRCLLQQQSSSDGTPGAPKQRQKISCRFVFSFFNKEYGNIIRKYTWNIIRKGRSEGKPARKTKGTVSSPTMSFEIITKAASLLVPSRLPDPIVPRISLFPLLMWYFWPHPCVLAVQTGIFFLDSHLLTSFLFLFLFLFPPCDTPRVQYHLYPCPTDLQPSEA